ncbi:MAG: aminopeptidase P family protein [Eubacteriales bacterium]|nr:aminopeptidase P family protein [Eubacteriales bacterium]MDY3332704.1 aminopeptidase P family protein [Gallibacter sp.]
MCEITNRVIKLRKYMAKKDVDAVIIFSEDAHQSEYVSEYWKGREYISGFSGSAGVALVTRDKAFVWTDGRYFLQASNQLEETPFEMMKLATDGCPTLEEWLNENLCVGAKISFDGRTISKSNFDNLKNKLKDINPIFMIGEDLLDVIWRERPNPIFNKLRILPDDITGESANSKIDRVIKDIEKVGATGYFISSLDDIAWLLNLRGSDVDMNQVFMSYAYISNVFKYIWLSEQALSEEVVEYIKRTGFEIKCYENINYDLENICEHKIYLDNSKVNVLQYNILNQKNDIVVGSSIIAPLKAKKNATEVDRMRDVHIRDGVAMVRFLSWLYNHMNEQAKSLDDEFLESKYPRYEKIDEADIADILWYFRSQGDKILSPSFDTIAGYGANGAIVHYKPEKEIAMPIEKDNLLLIDSGAQYEDGTTDITRTIAIGELTREQKENYTLVLKAHIAFSIAKFLYPTFSSKIDMLARNVMWQEGKDYKHGTGHGVGFALNVHEDPPTTRESSNTVLEKGYIMSNEPGYYVENNYGIRIENLVCVVDYKSTNDGVFYQFENLTMCPIDKRPIVIEMLDKEEIQWLNDYHKQVYTKLSPLISNVEREWLKKATKAI